VLNYRKLVADYHSAARSFSELVPWMSMVAPDTVVCLDGSLICCYELAGVDAEGLLLHERDRYANMLEQAFKVCDEHMTVWSFVDRRRINEFPDGHFDSPIGDAINQAWKEILTNGNQYANKHYMAFMYSPSEGAEGFFEAVNAHMQVKQQGFSKALIHTLKDFFSKKSAVKTKFEQLDAMKVAFGNKLREFEETVADLGFMKLETDRLLAFLHSRCSPASADQPVAMPELPAYLNTWLPDNTLRREHHHLIFEHVNPCYVGALSVKAWPNGASPGIIDALLSVPGEITVAQCFRFVDQFKARRYIEEVEHHHRSSAKSLVAMAIEAWSKEPTEQIDSGKLVLAEDAQQAMQELTGYNRHYGYYNMTVLGYGASSPELEENLKNISTGLRQRGFTLIRETLHLLSAFTATMPGQSKASFRWAFINIANMTDLAMIRTLSIGEKMNKHLTEQTRRPQHALTMFPTDYSTPFYFNFHTEDLPHTLVVGPSRSGKSTGMNFLISQFGKHDPCNRIIFDKDRSCWIPTLLQGGVHIDMDVREGSKVKMNPFVLLENEYNFTWLVDFLKMLVTARRYQLTAEDDLTMLNALRQLKLQPKNEWCLTNYVSCLPIKSLRQQFTPWMAKDGLYGKYFDNTEDDFKLSSFVCCEVGGLLGTEVAAPFMEYAFFRVNQMLDGRPTLIYIEECWFMLENPTFANKIKDWLKTLGKKNAFVVMATQSLDEIAHSEIFASIVDNMQTRIFLPNPNAYAHREMYLEKFQINESQLERIATATPKMQYYIVTPRQCRMVNVRLPKEIVACTSSDELSKRIFRKHWDEGNGTGEWQFDYVKERISV
jgi:type IV secretion/conjugal transfer VirB4 family ATPase